MNTQDNPLDKFLLTGLIVLFGAVHLCLLLKGVNDSTFSHAFDGFCGALLGLITGIKLGRAQRLPVDPTNGSPSPND